MKPTSIRGFLDMLAYTFLYIFVGACAVAWGWMISLAVLWVTR